MTWSVKSRPEEQEILSYAYANIAQELNATVAPVGLVWDTLRKTDQFDLYDVDGSHPSAHGSYLVAATMYATMFKEDPTGLSGVIEGRRLTSSGALTLATQELVHISDADAKKIQNSTWQITTQLEESKGLLDLQQPASSYSSPVLTEGENLTTNAIAGRWYGTSSYGSDYLGLIMDVQEKNKNLGISLSFYSPDRKDMMVIKDPELASKMFQFTMIDQLRDMNSQLEFALTDGDLAGLSTTDAHHVTQYKHLTLSRENIQNNLDLEALDQLMQNFESDISKIGYVDAAIEHYKKYSKLINSTYLPNENYLNVKGYNLLHDQKMKEALDFFELAMVLYPTSVNTYDSYGEALAIDGQQDKAINIYTQGYELAKKTGDPALAYIERSLKKLKEGTLTSPQGEAPLPPPPPQPQ